MSTPRTEQTTKKRLLSPDSYNIINSVTPIKKKPRQGNCNLVGNLTSDRNMAENETVPGDLAAWMAKISGQLERTVNKQDIELLATKQDIVLINDRITAQAHKIKQIRDEMGQYKKDLDILRESMDREEALKLNRKFRHVTIGNVNNMSDRSQNQTTRGMSTRNNIVIEGLKGDSETEILAEFLSLTTELKVIVYESDVDEIFHMKQRNDKIKTLGPVLVKLNHKSVRDSIMKNKSSLRGSETRRDVYINPDEPLETRRTKAISTVAPKYTFFSSPHPFFLFSAPLFLFSAPLFFSSPHPSHPVPPPPPPGIS